MLRMKLAGAIALAAAMFCATTRAAAPTLPPDVIGPDTIAVIHLNAAHFNPDGIQAAATAILGPNAAKVDDQLKKFKDKYDAAANAGVTALTVVVTSEKNGGGAPGQKVKPIMYLELKPGANVENVKTLITADMPPAEKDKTVFDSNGNFLAMHEKDQPLPAKADAEKTAAFGEALASMSDTSILIGLIPDETTRADMAKIPPNAPKGIQDAGPLLAKAKWFAFGVTLNNNPGLTATIASGSGDDAKALSDDISSALADLKAQAANPNANSNPMLAMAGPIINQLVDTLKPTTTGSQVTVSLKGPVLSTIANMAVGFGMLGGGPGGGPRPQ